MVNADLDNTELEENAAAAKLLQSCPTLRDPLDCSLPGSSVHGIFQARVLEWGAIVYSVNHRTESNLGEYVTQLVHVTMRKRIQRCELFRV